MSASDSDAKRKKHMVVVGVALLNTLLFSGTIFGYSALQLMLKKEGQYIELCHFNATAPVDVVESGCSEQTLKLQMMFTVVS
jgi:hypothetical protein